MAFSPANGHLSQFRSRKKKTGPPVCSKSVSKIGLKFSKINWENYWFPRENILEASSKPGFPAKCLSRPGKASRALTKSRPYTSLRMTENPLLELA
jgi:hypothetical protein